MISKPAGIDPLPLAVGALAGLVTVLPELIEPVANYGGDMLWHEGWIRQLADGQAEPTGVYAGVPNGYPWLFHSLGAWMFELLPGGMGDDPADARADDGAGARPRRLAAGARSWASAAAAARGACCWRWPAAASAGWRR